jgi:ammonium transporter, Amt family
MSKFQWSWVFVPLILAAIVACGLTAANTILAQEKAPESPGVTTPADEKPADAEPEKKLTPEEEIAQIKSDAATANAANKVAMDTIWVMVTGMLVFFMNLGFATVESGMCRAKNCVNILSKNFIVFAVTSIGFWVLGFGLMFGDGSEYIGLKGLLCLTGADNGLMGDAYKGDYPSLSWTSVPLEAKFFFQLVFAGTAATIVSGAVAERIKYLSFILFSVVMAVGIYPIVGHWIWGGGWLADLGFFDFAGSTVVHSVGGWSALVGVYILGPRIGKFAKDGKINAIPGHNMTAATIGCLILWLGWFGFNPGSTMTADPTAIAHVALTTNTAGAAATLSATAVAWIMLGKPDIGMTLNGCLAGLVAITAPCAWVSVPAAALIGVIAGALVVFGVLFFDRIKADDPVGATSVHLLNGVFGTLCVGLFTDPKFTSPTGPKPGLFYGGGMDQLVSQLIGVGAVAVYVAAIATVAWLVLKFTIGIRVSEAEEVEGLDLGEHGNEAYHGFQMSSE